MNGRRRKALKRMFRLIHGRDPRNGEAVAGTHEPTRLPGGILYDPHSYEFHGMRYEIKPHTVIEPSEWRRLKRALKTA